MIGLTTASKSKMHDLVDNLFDQMSLSLLGQIPTYRDKKNIVFTSKPDMTLAHLFLRSLESEKPTPKEREILKNLLSTAEEYVSSLRAKTKAELTERVDSYVKEQFMKGEKPSSVEIKKRINESFDKARSHFKTIIEAESTKARNMGRMAQISKVAASQGVRDPDVYFVVIRDGKTCSECKRLHLMPDGITPRVWKLSQLGFSYHKKGESNPKIMGLHPHCFTGEMRLHTSQGLYTFSELHRIGAPVEVYVDKRAENRKIPTNQFGVEIPGQVKLNRHISGSKKMQATHVYDTGIQNCLKITLDSGHSLEVSEGHEMWIDDDKAGVKIKASEVKIGDKIPLMSGPSGFGEDSFEDLAELMGNLMGDGALGQFAEFHFFEDDIEYGQTLLEKAKKFCGPNLSSELKRFPPNGKYNVERAVFKSQVLARIFKEEFDLSKKPRRVPERIFKATRPTVAAFLRGLFAADGHSEDNPSVVLVQNELNFLKDIQILLSNFGIISRIHKHGDQCEKTITYANGSEFTTNRKACWRLHIGGLEQVEYFVQNIGMGVPIKQAQLEERIATKNNPDKARFNWRTARVEKIEHIGKQQTYCLTEPMTNSVVSNGILTGNCRCSLAFLAPGFGFVNGRLTFVGQG